MRPNSTTRAHTTRKNRTKKKAVNTREIRRIYIYARTAKKRTCDRSRVNQEGQLETQGWHPNNDPLPRDEDRERSGAQTPSLILPYFQTHSPGYLKKTRQLPTTSKISTRARTHRSREPFASRREEMTAQQERLTRPHEKKRQNTGQQTGTCALQQDTGEGGGENNSNETRQNTFILIVGNGNASQYKTTLSPPSLLSPLCKTRTHAAIVKKREAKDTDRRDTGGLRKMHTKTCKKEGGKCLVPVRSTASCLRSLKNAFLIPVYCTVDMTSPLPRRRNSVRGGSGGGRGGESIPDTSRTLAT